ncbi:MAG: recombination mediator RecR [Candidatus Gracilibacteria bacterium]|nr:recombination mediator RecR [Candidatus Gracilibacteria bacterium]MDD2908302.1 recombination mediator RecR [Candidatus Gracilibacteria bacterium]
MPESLKKLIDIIAYLPGIGEKSAARLGFFLLKANSTYVSNFSKQLEKIKTQIKTCNSCFGYTDNDNGICSICSDNSRDQDVICVVEDYLDLISIEKLKIFKGQYHVLGGSISPVNGILPKDLKFQELFEKVKKLKYKEIILAINPNIEGEATSMYIKENLLNIDINITKLSKGLPNAGYIEYADEITLINAFKGRN